MRNAAWLQTNHAVVAIGNKNRAMPCFFVLVVSDSSPRRRPGTRSALLRIGIDRI